MPSTEARIETGSARRYLAQLCRHAAAMASGGGHRIRAHAAVTAEVALSVESSQTEGVIAFGSWGSCTVQAEADALIARIDGVDEQKLARIQGIIGRNLDRYARREGATITWQRIETTNTTQVPDAPPGKPQTPRRRLLAVALPAVVGVVAVAIHLGLGAAALNNWGCTRAALGLIALLVVVKAAFVLGGFAIRRRWLHSPR